ncbi:ABC transporter ATP-binding protein [soil metagenome]
MTVVLEQPHPRIATKVSSTVRIPHVSKRLEERPVLRDICLDIQAGEFVVLLGANGAGKSTLLKLIVGLLSPCEGSVELFGQSLRTGGAAARKRIGFIGHQSMLYRDLSARENVAFFARLYGVPNVAARTDEILRTVGLIDRANDAAKTFSRGMTQRLSIARALVHNPDLILADEPFAGLDERSTDGLQKLLARLHAAGRTLVVVNHDVAQSLRIARRAVVLSGGRIASDRPTEDLDVGTVLAEVIGQ